MKLLMSLVVLLLPELALAQCWAETTFTADGRTVFCHVCNYGGQITRTCF